MQEQFLSKAFSSVLFYVGWIVCIREGANGHSFYGLCIVLSLIAYFFYASSCRKADALLLGIVLLLGPLSDIGYVQLGLFQYRAAFLSTSWLPPLWVFSLWGLFAINIHLFTWLNRYKGLAFLLGAIGGPMSYLSVVRLGGVSLLQPLPCAWIIIGGVWAVFLPGSIWLNAFLKKAFQAAPSCDH